MRCVLQSRADLGEAGGVQMKAIRKCPGQGPEIVDIPSEEAVVEELGLEPRYIRLAEDLVIAWDGKWKEKGEKQNENILGILTGGVAYVLGYENGQLKDIPKLDFVLHGLFGAVRYGRADRANNVWNCRHCGHMEQFEADGPFENGWNLCPVCGGFILRPAIHCEAVANEG